MLHEHTHIFNLILAQHAQRERDAMMQLVEDTPAHDEPEARDAMKQLIEDTPYHDTDSEGYFARLKRGCCDNSVTCNFCLCQFCGKK